MPGAPAGVTAFVDVAVVPMDTERVLRDQTVLVAGGRITALGPMSQVPVPAGAHRIAGQGKYLIPGLADMHMHLGFGSFGGPIYLSMPLDTLVERRLFMLLADGVTTVRNVDYMNPWAVHRGFLLNGDELLRLRARAAAGALWSPRLYVAGQWGPDNYVLSPGRFWPTDVEWRVPNLDSVPTYLAAYKAAGYDFVKVHNESPAVFVAVLAAARAVGIPVIGHVPGTLEQALAGGMRSIEHLDGYPGNTASDSVVTAIAQATRLAGTWNCVTMEAGGSAHVKFVRALQGAGAGLLLGTDRPLGTTVHQELEQLVKAGLTPYEALATGTRNVARYLDHLDESGTITVGKRADLVLLNGNPLQDIRFTARPAGVMIGGRWLARPAIDRRLSMIDSTGGAGWPQRP